MEHTPAKTFLKQRNHTYYKENMEIDLWNHHNISVYISTLFFIHFYGDGENLFNNQDFVDHFFSHNFFLFIWAVLL